MNQSSHKPLWQGVCLVLGGAVGAGMFALPTASAGAWLIWSIAGLTLVWLMTYLSCSLLAKVNMGIAATHTDVSQADVSFSTLVADVLGRKWALLNNISIIFILMILMYAYSTASVRIAQSSLQLMGLGTLGIDNDGLKLGFVVCIALLVWLGTSIVGRFSLVLLLVMALLFGSVTPTLIGDMQFVDALIPSSSHWYLFSAIPVYVTAFACAGLVPTLVNHYSQTPANVFRSLFMGTLLTLLVYVAWVALSFGNVERAEFVAISAEGGGIETLVTAMVAETDQQAVLSRLSLFSHCAIVTSFLGIGLSLIHFVQDKLAFPPTISYKLVATIISFAPPTVASLFLPYGFVNAIGFAGLFVALSFYLVPGVLFEKARLQDLCHGSVTVSRMVIGFGLLVFVLKASLLLSLLPNY